MNGRSVFGQKALYVAGHARSTYTLRIVTVNEGDHLLTDPDDVEIADALRLVQDRRQRFCEASGRFVQTSLNRQKAGLGTFKDQLDVSGMPVQINEGPQRRKLKGNFTPVVAYVARFQDCVRWIRVAVEVGKNLRKEFWGETARISQRIKSSGGVEESTPQIITFSL